MECHNKLLALSLQLVIWSSVMSQRRYEKLHFNNPRDPWMSDDYGGNNTRSGRIFSFNKNPNNIRIELSFSIPFVTIPIGRNSTNQALADINLGAIISGAMLSAAAWLLVPKLFTGLSPEVSYSRSIEDGNTIGGVITKLDRALKDHHIDGTACAKRAVCWMVKNAATKLETGNASSVDKIVDGFVSMPWISDALAGSSMEEAIFSGRHSKDCSAIYSKCPFSKEKLKHAAKNLVTEIP